MKNKLPAFCALILLLLATIGCSMANKLVNEYDKSQPPKVLSSDDGKTQISVPSSWTVDKELNTAANIQASNRLGEQYVVVISESKASFGQKIDFDYVTKFIQDDMLKKMTNGQILGQTDATVGGFPAKLFEATGEISNVKVKYLYALVNAPQNFHQIITWTLQDRYDDNKSKLQDVINSFKDNDDSSTGEPPAPANIKSKRSK